MPEHTRASPMIKCIMLLSCMMASTLAKSTEYYYCYVLDDMGNQLRYYSDILSAEVEDIDDTYTGFAYCDEVEPQMARDYPGKGNATCRCNSSSSLSRLKKIHQKLPEDYSGPGRKHAFTRPPIPSATVNEEPPAPAILIEDVKPALSSPEELAALAAIERQVAAKKARIAAAMARDNAEMQAALAEQIRLRKLQGMKQ